jgi:hypothetical protein
MAQVRAATPQERAVRFVVLSDDVAWCRERLEGVKDVVFPQAEKDKVEEEQKNEKKNKNKNKEEEREEKATRNFVPGKGQTPKETKEVESHRVTREERSRRGMNAKEKKEKKKKKKEKLIMDTDPDRVVEDFILLTQMNQTVYDYGSFGFWSAVLSGTGVVSSFAKTTLWRRKLRTPFVVKKTEADSQKKVWTLAKYLFSIHIF